MSDAAGRGLPLAEELPVELTADGRRVAVLMCTPRNLDDLAVGHLFCRGMLTDRARVLSVGACADRRVMTVTAPGAIEPDRYGLGAVIASGCGSASILDEAADIEPLPPGFAVPLGTLKAWSAAMFRSAELYRATGGMHIAALAVAATEGGHGPRAALEAAEGGHGPRAALAPAEAGHGPRAALAAAEAGTATEGGHGPRAAEAAEVTGGGAPAEQPLGAAGAIVAAAGPAALPPGAAYFVAREDVGRHNAVDKVLGRGFMDGVDFSRACVLTSGRIAADMILKAAAARVPLLVSRSVPTTSAYEIARQAGVTIVGRVGDAEPIVYTCPERVRA